jgi:hypothetical protein
MPEWIPPLRREVRRQQVAGKLRDLVCGKLPDDSRWNRDLRRNPLWCGLPRYSKAVPRPMRRGKRGVRWGLRSGEEPVLGTLCHADQPSRLRLFVLALRLIPGRRLDL